MHSVSARRAATISPTFDDPGRGSTGPDLRRIGSDPAPANASALERRREEQAIDLCDCLIDITSTLYNVSGKELRKPGRSSLGVSRVRQIAMYVAHVVLGLSMRDVGKGFGRERTTVLHACHLIEDLRDDPDFDRFVAVTERIASVAFRNRVG